MLRNAFPGRGAARREAIGGLAHGRSRSPRRGVLLALALALGVVTVDVSQAARRDEIGAVKVAHEGAGRVSLRVDYGFDSQAHARSVYLGAWALQGGERVGLIGYGPVRLSAWSGSRAVELRAESGYRGISDGFEVFLIEADAAAPFAVRRCKSPIDWGAAEGPRPSGPDLMVSAIQVYPEKQAKRAGQPLRVQVYARNDGTVASGPFEVTVKIVDVMRGYVYPKGTQRHEAMHPGEDYAVYVGDEIVTYVGLHRVVVEIQPIFHEPSTCNNVEWRGFVVE